MILPEILQKGRVPLFAQGLPLIESKRIMHPAVVLSRTLAVAVPDVHKDRDNWCWAAVAVGIADAYSDTGLSQCYYARQVISRSCCTKRGDCNNTRKLSEALGVTGHDHLELPLLNKPHDEWSFIVNHIDTGKPFCVRVAYPDTVNGHVIVVYGYDHDSRGRPRVAIGDPASKRYSIPLNELISDYNGHGPWGITYETKGRDRVPEI